MTLSASQLKPATAYNVSGLPHAAQAYWLAETINLTHSPFIHIAASDKEAEVFIETVRYFAPELQILYFPAWDCLPYDRISPSHKISAIRLKTLSELYETGQKKLPYLLVTTLHAASQKILPRHEIAHVSSMLTVDSKIIHDHLNQILNTLGYQRVSKVMEPGEYAVRGGIIDVFPSGEDHAIRIDLFDDKIDSLKRFDPLTQISTESVNQCVLHPISEVFLNAETIDRFRTRYRELFGLSSKDDLLYQSISDMRTYAGAEHWLPLFYDTLDTILDYAPHASLSLDANTETILIERQKEIHDYYQARKDHENARGQEAVYHPIAPETLYLAGKNFLSIIERRCTVFFSQFLQSSSSAFTLESSLGTAPALYTERHLHQGNIWSTIADFIQSQTRASIFACNSQGSLERLSKMLSQQHIQAKQLESWQQQSTDFSNTDVWLTVLSIEQGFTHPNFIVFSEQDALGERIIRTQKRRKKSDAFMAEAESLCIGEYVVHQDHGIARFDGLITLDVTGSLHDCLKLIYADDDKLFLPVENIDLISRYGNTESQIELDKLGGIHWQKRKAILKNRLKLAAEALLKIAAERAMLRSNALEADLPSYQEFVSRFAYTETDDQLQSIEDVLTDLRSGKPMDRLICGDVGFGKTEVAMRAAFCAVSASPQKMQVAIITPTTLLARQHYQSFKTRFSGFSVRIRQLSRLVKAKEANQTKSEISSGEADIVIGTHALLAKDVAFKNLGLVIVDEEQHFGVAQKEKLKSLKSNVHVLTLSATPIPRTLQLALSGVRELSLITTPPVDRLAVRTYIMPYDPLVLREAMMREYHRGGKIFYVTPRVRFMPDIQQKLKTLVPELKICVAHGQMAAQALDTIMNDFYDGKYDILLSTAIIESGIDIPTANTMIIDHAELFGLSQLYQLRGRVGRSKTRAYAYFTLPYQKVLSKDAMRRLEVMQQLDTLGAGFSLASHDMDIRGFGNVLGEEQSGHIKEVGIELYQSMLEEAIAQQKNKQGITESVDLPHDWSPTINIGSSVLIPESYVSDLSLRLGLYRRAAQLNTESDIEAFAGELVNRFGSLPAEVEHFIDILRIKLWCKIAGIERIDAGPKGALLGFRNDQFARPEKLIQLIQQQPQKYKIRSDQKFVVMQLWEDAFTRLKGVETVTRLIADIL